IEVNANDRLVGLYQELSAYPSEDRGPADAHGIGDYVIPLRVRDAGRELAFFCTTTVFGTPQDITVAELAIEQFFPADADTGAALPGLAGRVQMDGIGRPQLLDRPAAGLRVRLVPDGDVALRPFVDHPVAGRRLGELVVALDPPLPVEQEEVEPDGEDRVVGRSHHVPV